VTGDGPTPEESKIVVPYVGSAIEQASRFNDRREEMNDYERFRLAASQIVGKRLTWTQGRSRGEITNEEKQ
jgi:hypothetical protein